MLSQSEKRTVILQHFSEYGWFSGYMGKVRKGATSNEFMNNACGMKPANLKCHVTHFSLVGPAGLGINNAATCQQP